MENIKEALEYSVELAANEVKIEEDKAGKEWFDANNFSLRELNPKKYPSALKVRTLTGLINYLTEDNTLDGLVNEKLIIHVKDPENVELYTELDEEQKRKTFMVVEAQVPEFRYGRFHSVEEFNIKLQSVFLQTNERDLLLSFSSAISIDNGAKVEDNGVSQTTTIRNGVSSISNAVAPNPVSLKPFRTFTEVDQPESDFVFRLNKDAELALFEADGGIWKNEAMIAIKGYLEENLRQFENIQIIA